MSEHQSIYRPIATALRQEPLSSGMGLQHRTVKPSRVLWNKSYSCLHINYEWLFFLKTDSLASTCAYKSGFTGEWELTRLARILQQIVFFFPFCLVAQPLLFLRHSGVGFFGYLPCHRPIPLSCQPGASCPQSTWQSSALVLGRGRRDSTAPSSGGTESQQVGPWKEAIPPPPQADANSRIVLFPNLQLHSLESAVSVGAGPWRIGVWLCHLVTAWSLANKLTVLLQFLIRKMKSPRITFWVQPSINELRSGFVPITQEEWNVFQVHQYHAPLPWSIWLMSGFINHDPIENFTSNADLPKLEVILSCRNEWEWEMTGNFWGFEIEKSCLYSLLATLKKILSVVFFCLVFLIQEGEKGGHFSLAVTQTLQQLSLWMSRIANMSHSSSFSTLNSFCRLLWPQRKYPPERSVCFLNHHRGRSVLGSVFQGAFFWETILSGDNQTSFSLWLGGNLFLSAHFSMLRILRCWGDDLVGKSTSM